jgi:autophagy-related protein 18
VAAIPAHESPLAAIAFNNSGTRLATASTTGTVIRVFSIPSGDKVFEFRRGMKRFIHINCLSFSQDDLYLATSSSTETVHIFKLIQPSQERAPEEQQGWMSYIGKAIGNTASYLGSDALSMNRAFAHMKLPKPGLRSVCTVTFIDGAHRILVATSEGRLYVGGIDPREGGDCKILKDYSLTGDPADEEDGAIASASGGMPTYASVASHGPPVDHTHQGSPDSHMTRHRDSHEQNLAADDEKPPSTHTVHS